MELNDALAALNPSSTMCCWCGTLYDRKHPWVRADSVWLLLASHNAGGSSTFTRVYGYRPASVKASTDLDESDYTLVFDPRLNVIIIRGSTPRAGRHALPDDLEEGEVVEKATETWTGRLPEADRIPTWVRYASTAFAKVSEEQPPIHANALSIPCCVLVSSQEAVDNDRVLSRSHVRGALAYETFGDKIVFRADDAYGQGVLAFAAGFPMGQWISVPKTTSAGTPAVRVPTVMHASGARRLA